MNQIDCSDNTVRPYLGHAWRLVSYGACILSSLSDNMARLTGQQAVRARVRRDRHEPRGDSRGHPRENPRTHGPGDHEAHGALRLLPLALLALPSLRGAGGLARL